MHAMALNLGTRHRHELENHEVHDGLWFMAKKPPQTLRKTNTVYLLLALATSAAASADTCSEAEAGSW